METKKRVHARSKKIALVADENLNDNLLICKMLESEGFCAASAFDLPEALELLRKIPLDLVVIDSSFDSAEDIIELVSSEKRMVKIPILLIRNKSYYKDDGTKCNIAQTMAAN